jgi:hypothetical protein
MPDLLTQVTQMYNQLPGVKKMGFLTSLFKTRPDSFTDVDRLNLDVVYGGADVAPVVRDLSTGAIRTTQDRFGAMSAPFPVYSLERAVSIASLMERQPGENAFITERVNWTGRLAARIRDGVAKHIDMIKRSVEAQAAQVLQTGKATLADEDGNPVNELDYQVPESHFAEVTVGWSDSGADPLADMTALDDMLEDDALCDMVNYVFGKSAWNNFLRNDFVQKNLDKNALNTMAIAPEMRDKGAKYLGRLNYDGKERLFWGYDAKYSPWKQPEVSTAYLAPDKVLFLPAFEDMDFRRYFGGIPNVKQDPIFDSLFGGKITIEGEFDFTVRVRWDDDAETYIGRVKSRPLLVPASRLRFGCLTTEPASA